VATRRAWKPARGGVVRGRDGRCSGGGKAASRRPRAGRRPDRAATRPGGDPTGRRPDRATTRPGDDPAAGGRRPGGSGPAVRRQGACAVGQTEHEGRRPLGPGRVACRARAAGSGPVVPGSGATDTGPAGRELGTSRQEGVGQRLVVAAGRCEAQRGRRRPVGSPPPRAARGRPGAAGG
jgi:hypothetical protein